MGSGKAWESLKEIPFKSAEEQTDHESNNLKYETEPLASNTEITNSNRNDAIRHPAAERLNQLKQGLLEAQKNGDDDAIKGYQEAMKHTIFENPLEVSPEEWDNMNDTAKTRFYELKMKEAKTLGDRDAFDFWNASLKKHNSDK